MLRVGITGNIASGKTSVQKIIEKLGYKVLDTDIVAHKLLENSAEIKLAFKDFDILDKENNISREKLGKIVFNDEGLRKKLEEILHPKIKSEIIEFFNQNSDEELLFVGIPLLFEAGMQNLFDKIILVYTEDCLREKRLIERNNYTAEYARLRMNCQISQDEKKGLVDFVINNNGTFGDLESSVSEILSKF